MKELKIDGLIDDLTGIDDDRAFGNSQLQDAMVGHLAYDLVVRLEDLDGETVSEKKLERLMRESLMELYTDVSEAQDDAEAIVRGVLNV
jgi:aminoglycoside/choline kinase family phosphotransferase